jgi:hypothetical protein
MLLSQEGAQYSDTEEGGGDSGGHAFTLEQDQPSFWCRSLK